MTDREYPSNPTGSRALIEGQGRRDRKRKVAEDKAWMRIRNGVRSILQGIEELKGLPRSFETKREQGRRQEG